MMSPATIQLLRRDLVTAFALPSATMRLIVTGLLLTSLSTFGSGQGLEAIPLHERDPFDRLTLDKENKSAQVDVFPIDSIDRTKRVAVPPKSVIIRRIQDPPDRRYSVNGKHIVKLELFPFILLDEMTGSRKRKLQATIPQNGPA